MFSILIPSFNNLNYLKLAIKSVRQNAYYKDMPIIVHTENCTDGTDKWLEENKEKEKKGHCEIMTFVLAFSFVTIPFIVRSFSKK